MVPILLILLSILIILGYKEYYQHLAVLEKFSIRIHVNGSRGKSSVTRLIAAGLRAGGFRTMAKTTGSSPRIIDTDGKDRMIQRLRSPSIGEQVKLMQYFSKQNLDAVVMECMAVQPEYQWISEQKMQKSTIGVITNIRPDHLDEMGPTMDDVTRSLSNTIPFNGNVVVTQGKHNDTLKKIAASRETKLTIATTDDIKDGFMEKFSHLEHKENVATALEVCKQVGIDEGSALEGMLKVQPDPGALFIKKIQFGDNHNFFVNAFAANDPLSTLNILELIKKQIPLHPTCVFLNTRADRRSRTNQMITLVSETIQPDIFLIRGDKLPEIPAGLFKLTTFPDRSKPEDIIEHLSTLTNHVIFGIGNMVGWGERFVKKLKDFQSDD